MSTLSSLFHLLRLQASGGALQTQGGKEDTGAKIVSLMCPKVEVNRSGSGREKRTSTLISQPFFSMSLFLEPLNPPPFFLSPQFLVGIILQFASYIFFLCLAIRCHLILISFSKSSPNPQPYASINKLFAVLYFSSVFIIIRCAFRTAELAGGFRGYLITHEVFFYVLDSLPLIVAIGIYVPFYPSSFYPFSNKFERRSRPFTPLWDLGRRISDHSPVSNDKEVGLTSL